MADAPVQAARKTARVAPKAPRPRPDIATLAGITVALAGILGGLLLEKGSIQDVAQVTAAMIVIGGTLGAVLVTTPLPVFLRACKGLVNAFLETGSSTADTIESLIRYATMARKGGIVSLEAEAADRRTLPIQTLGPGEDLGWSWLFPPYLMHFAARALEPTRVILFYGTRLRQQCEEDHDFGYEIMKRVAACPAIAGKSCRAGHRFSFSRRCRSATA